MTCVVVPPSPNDSILDARVVYLIQTQLALLSWVDACYGIAEVSEMKKDDGGIERFPRVYSNLEATPKQYTDVRYDESIGAQLFFERDGVIQFGQNDEQDEVTYPLAIVGWANLSIVDPDRNYDFTDKLAGAVVTCLRDNFSAEIAHNIQIELRSENAYSKYTMKDVENRFITLPYTAFRISFTYTEFQSGLCYEFTPLLTGIGFMEVGDDFTIA